MARSKWINKKTAQHFTLVHRPQNDPLIHDSDAPAMVLNPTQPKPGSSELRRPDALASQMGVDATSIRVNEGEAASYGVYFDDSEYDYMQHLRDLGQAGGQVVFVEATTGNKDKGKRSKTLAESLRDMDLKPKASDALDEEILPSKNLTRVTYEAQQNVPDSIRGFQPDMDPRLREVLEALDDDAYVEGEDDDFFQQLAKDGRELDDVEFEQTQFDEDEGWESDRTARPGDGHMEKIPQLVAAQTEKPQEGPSQDWLEDFEKFKRDQKSGKAPVAPSQSELQSTWTATTNGGRRKKRKGALTDASSFSMTSSSLVRTEQLRFLDARYERMYEKFNEDAEDDMESVSAVSTASSVAGPLRRDFDGAIDHFLDNFTKPGKRTSKKSKAQTGLQQLDEIRRDLGPARIRGR
ncbi:hypothetical protein CDD81_3625 [Ophiocordyceps australis]|uniref:Low temperature viability protein n=1 Tax=Ophiocordyceps australis TaxID=1399860 RepID=A0A2C5XJK9_9HYPO|nr:hypothetical protein CDD81_3625 [Ophiocordyceps australis]